jgi:hypothetical protein
VANAPALLAWARDARVRLTPALRAELREGFGSSADGEDRFDAAVGLFGMLNVVLGRRLPGDPADDGVRKVEGWILGQSAEGLLVQRPRVREASIASPSANCPTGLRTPSPMCGVARSAMPRLFGARGARAPVRAADGCHGHSPHGQNLFRHKVHAAVHTLNGYGKPFGFEQVRELGVIESPIALTNTLNVGRVADALVEYSIRQNPDIGITASSVNVVVGETNDAWLNDLQGVTSRRARVGGD